MPGEPENDSDLEMGTQFLQFLEEKRSVRNYKPRRVETRKIELMVHAALSSPFSGKSPCWHLLAVSDDKVLDRVHRAATAGLNKMNFWVRTAPCMIVLCAKPGASKKRQGIPYYLVDSAIALERASLMAHQLGLGSCWIGNFDERGVRRACRIPAGIRVVGLLSLGYPEKDGESILGVQVINDFDQYYDLIRSKFDRNKRVPLHSAFSYNYFP